MVCGSATVTARPTTLPAPSPSDALPGGHAPPSHDFLVPRGFQAPMRHPLQNARAQMALAKRHPKRHRSNTFSCSGAGYAPGRRNPAGLSVADPRRNRATIHSLFCRLSAATPPLSTWTVGPPGGLASQGANMYLAGCAGWAGGDGRAVGFRGNTDTRAPLEARMRARSD